MPMARDTDITSGSLRGVTGKLERVRLNAATYSATGTCMASVSIGDTSSGNRDGSALRAVLTASTTVPGRAVVRDVVYGRVVGVRFLSNNASNLFPFDVVIDGVAYRVDPVYPQTDNRIVAAVDQECFIVVAEDLPDTRHTVEAHLVAETFAAKRLEVSGWLGEAGRGYSIPPEVRAGTVTDNPITVPTTLTQISYTGQCAGLSFINSDSTAHVVILARSGGNVYRTVSVPAAAGGIPGTAQITFPIPHLLSAHQWKVDSGNFVTAFTEGI